MVRLRQLVLAARALPPAVDALRALLRATSAHVDSDVAVFGLANTVVPAGSDFVEVVSPQQPGTAAGRWLDRHGGDGGYMLMVDGPLAMTGPARLEALALRTVHRVDLPDVVDVHLHPRDTGGVLLALDAVDPAGSWRWAGPQWTGRAPAARGGLRAVTVAVPDPAVVARRWAQVLDVPPADDDVLRLDEGQQLRFVPTGASVASVVAATLALPVPAAQSDVVAGVALDVVPLEEGT